MIISYKMNRKTRHAGYMHTQVRVHQLKFYQICNENHQDIAGGENIFRKIAQKNFLRKATDL